MTLSSRCFAIYESEGSNDVVGVNRLVRMEYPEANKRVRALTELEDTGLWEIKWHYSSRVPGGRPDEGVVMAYLG